MLLNKLIKTRLLVPALIIFGGFIMIALFVLLEVKGVQKLETQELLYTSKSYLHHQNAFLGEFTKHNENALLTLRKHESFKAYLEGSDSERIKSFFRFFIEYESYVMQLRFIDADGMEALRFERQELGSQPIEVSGEKLQDKAHRNYVKANLYQPERIAYSVLDLNIEHGSIQEPFNPTYRNILPVWHKGKFRGLLVVNYFAQQILEAVFEAEHYEVRILDAEGYILTSSNKDEEWSRYAQTPFKIDEELIPHLSDKNLLLEKSILLPLDTPFLNPLWLQVRPSKGYVEFKHRLERDEVIKVASIIAVVNILLGLIVYGVMYRLKVQLEDARTKHELHKELLSRSEKIVTMSQALDKYVITSTTDLRGRITDVSQAFCDISGYSKEELIGASHRIVRHPDMDSRLYEDLWTTIKADKTWVGEIKNRCKDGNFYWVHASIEPLYDHEGKKIGYSAVREDITNQKLLEEEQKNLNALSLRTDLALEASNIGIWEWEYKGDRIFWDKRMYELYDVPAHNQMRTFMSWINMIIEDQREKVKEDLLRVVVEGGEYSASFWIITPTGEKRYMHVLGKNEFNSDGQAYRMVGISMDITKQKNIEDNLYELVDQETNKRLEQTKLMVQQSKFAAMGEMMANIAHQWKQPLMMLSMGVLVLQKKFLKGGLDEETMQEYVDKTNEITGKMNQTILDFSEYFAPNKQMSTFDLSETIGKSVQFLDSVIKKHEIVIETQILVEDATTIGYENELSQVFLNLIKNSIDAIIENDVPQGYIKIVLKESGDQWIVEFNDNGGGFAQNVINHIFEPYFTTKFKDNGTGIGLYMSKMIIEESLLGRISASNTEAGAQITVVLPKGK